MFRSSHRDERGAAATLLVVTGVLVGVAIVTAMVLPLATATDAKSRSRTTADAAALAGADGIVGDLESIITSGSWNGMWDGLTSSAGSGLPAAETYVTRNDPQARLTDYSSRIDGLTWVVEVRVESPPVQAGTDPVRSYARAEIGLPDCSFDVPEPPPETTPPPGDEDDEDEETEPEPEPGPDLTITCDGNDWTVEDEGTTDDPRYDIPGGLVSSLLDSLEPRLVA